MTFKEYIDENKINQQKLAEVLGITYQALFVKLKGKGNFSCKQAIKLKHFLRLSEAEFEEFFG